jgi:LPS O-antigen subunit length determinant protein (WzzB/FepE family)
MLTFEELNDCMINDQFVFDGHSLYKVEEIKATKNGTRLKLKAPSIEKHIDLVDNKLSIPCPWEVVKIQEVEANRRAILLAEWEEKRKKEEAEKAAIEAEKKRVEEQARQQRQARIQHLLEAAVHIDRDKIKSMNLQKIAIPDPNAQWGDDPPLYGYILAVIDNDEVLFVQPSSSGYYGLQLFSLCDSFIKEIELL